MTHEDLLERIKRLNVQLIEEMSPEVMARLTHNFEELLVRNLLYTATTNSEQRKLIKLIKEGYKSWKGDTPIHLGSLSPFIAVPEYMNDLQMDIECGMVITEKGTFSENSARLKLSLIPMGAGPLKPLQKKNTDEHVTVDTIPLQARIDELEKKNAELEKDNKELREELANKALASSNEYEEMKQRSEVLESLNQANEKRLKNYESILGTEEELSKEKHFSITERIIFCSALLGCSLSEDGISQMQMAKLISRFSGDKHEAIRTTINKINKKLKALVEVAEKAKQEKDAGARDSIWRVEGEKYIGITNAALNVYKFLHAAVKGQTIGAKVHYCQQAMENINQAYYLTERKLINKTDWQPKGEFELPPEEI